MALEIDYDVDYTAPNDTGNNSYHSPFGPPTPPPSLTSLTVTLAVVNVLTCVLGLTGNSLVVWICGWKMKRTTMNEKVITTWYISLAVSNLLFCAVLPLDVYYLITQNWPFGSLLCKMASSMMVFNMYCSVFILVLISVDRFVMVTFPIWSHNHRSVWVALAIVAMMWVLSFLLTLPSMIHRDTIAHDIKIKCHTPYTPAQHKSVALSRFFCGFFFPFLIIVACAAGLVLQLRNKPLKSAKPYKIMAALIGSFFLCWMPYNTLILMELNANKHGKQVMETGMKIVVALAATNSFITPILYVFIGREFKMTLKRSLSTVTEPALGEESRSGRTKSSEILAQGQHIVPLQDSNKDPSKNKTSHSTMFTSDTTI